MHSRSSLEKHTRFQSKVGKVCTRFQTKTEQNWTRWGGSNVIKNIKCPIFFQLQGKLFGQELWVSDNQS